MCAFNPHGTGSKMPVTIRFKFIQNNPNQRRKEAQLSIRAAGGQTGGPLLQVPTSVHSRPGRPPRGRASPWSPREPRGARTQAVPLCPGLCIFVSVEVLRQSVKRMIDSEDTVWIEYYYSWSFACACAAFVLLFLGGLALLLFSLPRMPRNPWESCMDSEPEH